MKWQKNRGPILRKVGEEGPNIILEKVEKKEPGDLDLSHIEIWMTNYKGHSYVISTESTGPNKDLGYTASVKTIVGEKVIGQAQVIAEFVRTFTEAERACENHARGRRDS